MTYQKSQILQFGGVLYLAPERPPWIRRFDPGAFFNYYHDASNPGNFQQGSIYIFPVYIIFTNGSFLQYALFPTWQNINSNFAPLGVSIEQDSYYYTRHSVNFNTDQSAKLSGSGSISWGKFHDGRRTTLSAGLRYAPSVHAAITVDYEYNDLTNLGISQTDLSTHLMCVGTRFTLNPRLQLSTFYQYNSFGKLDRWNLRLSWEYQPLSFLYVVFNDGRIVDNLDDAFIEQQVISKITFVKQF